MNAIVQYNTADVMTVAQQLVASGFLPAHIKQAQAFAIITLGQELGIGAWAALNGINVIQNKPTVSPQLMLGLINRTGQLEDMGIGDDGKACSVTMKRRGRSAHTEIFSDADAQRLGLSGKSNWKSQPAVMRKWRAVAACARVVFPDVIQGLYTPEEIAPDSVSVNDDGEMTLDAQQPASAPQLTASVETIAPSQERPLEAKNGKSAAKETREFICDPTVWVMLSSKGKPYYSLRIAETDEYAFTWERAPFRNQGWSVDSWKHDERDGQGATLIELDRYPLITCERAHENDRWTITHVAPYADCEWADEAVNS